MRATWLERREESGLRRAALAPLGLAALGYGAAARVHRAIYARGLRTPRRLSCRVVSVGNVVVGGSGKTPMTAWIARELRGRGYKVAIASRGYRRRSREPVVVVSDGRYVHAHAGDAGDEPWLLAAHAPGVPVLVGPARDVVGLRAISQFGTQVLVLDDGFQHHRLARDVDLVVFDGGGGLGNGRVLPRGPLREPASALRRADGVGVIDGPLPEDDAHRIARLAAGAFRFSARRRPLHLRRLDDGSHVPLEALDRRQVGMIAGVARPASFRRTLESLRAAVVAERIFRDHHAYRAKDLRGLGRRVPVWVTTEKDALKMTPAWAADAEVWVLAIDLEVEQAARLLDWLEIRLR